MDPTRDSAPASREGVHALWSRSPLCGPVRDLAGELRSVADDAGFVAAVTDEDGTILWTYGGRVMRRRAERVNFAPGGRWDEPAMGTNALSLALRTGLPSMVFSAEHLVAALHGWVCYCAPVHGPDGRVLGVLDLSTTWDRSHPLAMSTVRMMASVVEGALRDRQGAAAGSPPAGGRLELSCLGDERATRGGAPMYLPPRRLEILALLALEPEGWCPDRLREALYGSRPVSASTFKAEVSHLRRALGGQVATRRYELTVPVVCDAVQVLRALERGDTATAVELYRGPLLPHSEAPGTVRWREHIEVAARRDAIVNGLSDDSQVKWAVGAGIEVIRGRGRLSEERTVVVTTAAGGTRKLTARHAGRRGDRLGGVGAAGRGPAGGAAVDVA